MATTKKASTKKKIAASIPKSKTRATSASETKAHVKAPTKSARKRRLAPVKADKPFMTFRVTRQTIYWGIISAVVLGLGLWVIDINDKVMHIYDQIDQMTLQAEDGTVVEMRKESN